MHTRSDLGGGLSPRGSSLLTQIAGDHDAGLLTNDLD
ncbi:unannotated protein [freshwater metagenome]|uniref:Unannotated protein n=1 Tax=freshwater metagenome TaxID=449393 RepID=A0A6J7LPC7_9ZZZZ